MTTQAKKPSAVRDDGRARTLENVEAWLDGSAKRAGRDSDQFIVRLRDGMREYLAEVAEREGRSMNAVVVTALAIYFAQEGTPLHDRVKNELGDVRTAIEKLTEEVAKLRRGEK
jgi:hypothetical protein